MIKKLKPAVLTTRLGIDLINSDNPLFLVRLDSMVIDLQILLFKMADLILIIGARMDTGITDTIHKIGEDMQKSYC